MNIPLAFSHVYTSAPWGGSRISSVFGRTDTPEICAESWEISGHPSGMSVVRGGPLDGRTLADLTQEYGAELVGTKAPDAHRFPLLMKLIDAHRALSVQVHPNERTAPLTGGEPKTEAWVVLAADNGAALYAGTVPGTTEESFGKALREGDAIASILRRHEVREGDAFFIRGGVVHAIDAGCLIYEVQQSSNTTYRLYDWGRVGPDGKGRPLHIEQALKSIDTTFPDVSARRATPTDGDGSAWRTYVESPFFAIRELELKDETTMSLDGSTFASVFVFKGAARVACEGGTVEARLGTSVLVPATAGACRLSAIAEGTRLIVATL